jgi:membrane-associated phospholipid phosphatase
MQAIYRTISRSPAFFSAFLFFLVSTLAYALLQSKTASFLQLNSLHNPVLDLGFNFLTYLGDGLFSLLAAAAIWLFWKKPIPALQVLIAFLVSGLLAQLFKNLFSFPRPMAALARGSYPYFLDGITHSGFNSFPSGHTTSAFALATLLALFSGSKTRGLAFLLIAVGVGYSRIYLGQHFLPDVIAGSVLGTLTAIVIYTLGPRNPWPDQKEP